MCFGVKDSNVDNKINTMRVVIRLQPYWNDYSVRACLEIVMMLVIKHIRFMKVWVLAIKLSWHEKRLTRCGL